MNKKEAKKIWKQQKEKKPQKRISSIPFVMKIMSCFKYICDTFYNDCSVWY